MHLIEVVPLGPLSKYPSLKIAANSVAEAIEGWSRQVIPSGRQPIISAIGYDSEEALRAETTVERVELLPTLCGGGSFGKILLGAALIAVAVWNPGIGGMILSQAGVTAVATVGLGLVLGGLMGLFMKAPSLSKESDPPASKYIGNARMTTEIGTPMGIGGGRMLIGGHLLSLQVNSSDLVYGRFPETIS